MVWRANKKKKHRGIYMLGLLLLFSFVGGVSAKYIYKTQTEKAFRAKEFYFKSNLLTDKGNEYYINFDSENVVFELCNNGDALRFSEDKIRYTISVESTDGNLGSAKLNIDESSIVPEINDATTVVGFLEEGAVDKAKVSLYGLENNKTYVVTATGISFDDEGREGYEQKITATFKMGNKDEAVYKHLSNAANEEAFVLLTVWTTNIEGDLSVAYNNDNLIPDTTNPILENVEINKESVKSIEFIDNINYKEIYSSYTYRFFKSNSNDITINDFVVELSDGNVYLANEATPK